MEFKVYRPGLKLRGKLLLFTYKFYLLYWNLTSVEPRRITITLQFPAVLVRFAQKRLRGIRLNTPNTTTRLNPPCGQRYPEARHATSPAVESGINMISMQLRYVLDSIQYVRLEGCYQRWLDVGGMLFEGLLSRFFEVEELAMLLMMLDKWGLVR